MTTEVVAHPPGADLASFEWRISMAQVATAGPFSTFPGCDRTLCVLAGGPLSLRVDGRDTVQLDPGSQPYEFAADRPTEAVAVPSPLTDLNVIYRRDAWRASVERCSPGRIDLAFGDHEICIAIAPAGGVRLLSPAAVDLGPGDAIVFDPHETDVAFLAGPDAALYLVRLRSRATPPASAGSSQEPA